MSHNNELYNEYEAERTKFKQKSLLTTHNSVLKKWAQDPFQHLQQDRERLWARWSSDRHQ